MTSILSIGVSKITSAGYLTRLCKISQNHNALQVAFIKRLSLCDPIHKPPPFRYWEKSYSLFQMIKNPVTMRFDENTKVIVVDGPPAVGKTKLCEKLAEEFGMLYMPPPTHDELYINPYGYDIREVDSKLPLNCQSFDLERFLANPFDIRVSFFQILYLFMRFEQYANALLHLLSTGQGIVLNRCIYSDIAFAEAMLKAGYLSKNVWPHYMYMREKGCMDVYRPHLIIYLDVPSELVKEKIKKSGNSHEVNSKVFTTKFLSDLENAYKERYLKDLSQYSHILMYDWSKEGNYMDVIHDIEQIDFDTVKEPKFQDWEFTNVGEIHEAIELFQKKLPIIVNMYGNTELPPRELYWTSEESNIMQKTISNIPSEKYEYGFNINFGDNVLFKREKPILHYFRKTPRDFVNRTL